MHAMARQASSARTRRAGARGSARTRARAQPRRRGTARARRRARRRRIAAVTGLALASVLALAVAAVLLVGPSAPRALAPLESPPATVAYDPDQVGNAVAIMRAGRDLGLTVRDQAIAVMTAMGESSLRTIDYGDWETSGVTNPDGTPTTSIGLFQQQDGWGTRAQRLDPYTSATLFYRAMVERVPGRDGLTPTEVAHRTQVNADPHHYERYWPLAVDLVEKLSGQGSGLAR